MTTHNRQRIKTASGLELHRSYVYLPESVWEDLYALSKASGVSASAYICNLINSASIGAKVEKDFHDSTNPSASVSH